MGKRRIFEEVTSLPGPDATPQILPGTGGGRRGVRIWLFMLLVMTVLTVFVGGMTRLTDSGLSITEWKPVTGALPPFGETQWQSEFEKYRQTPEYNLQNSGMTMSEFRTIYWWEWTHRQLGRLIGLLWISGFAYFALHGELRGRRRRRLLAVGVLIAAQGAIGWWMVASGLSGEALDVAPYRLALHLGLAFVISGLTFWEFMLLSREQHELAQARRSRDSRLEQAAGWLIALIGVQLLAGAIVAGTDAGQGFPTWPLMNGEIIPSNSFALEPWLTNFVSNPSLAHFNHRILGYLTVAAAIVIWSLSRASGTRSTKTVFTCLLALTLFQTALGIATALMSAPLPIAILHQLSATVLFLAALWARFSARYPKMAVR